MFRAGSSRKYSAAAKRKQDGFHESAFSIVPTLQRGNEKSGRLQQPGRWTPERSVHALAFPRWSVGTIVIGSKSPSGSRTRDFRDDARIRDFRDDGRAVIPAILGLSLPRKDVIRGWNPCIAV